MSYIGNSLPANFQSLPAVQRFNGDGSDTTFTLAAQIANDQSILVSVDGVTQDSNAYSVSGTTLTFTSAPSAGTGNIFVNTISPVGSTIVPPDGSVSTVKLADEAVTKAKTDFYISQATAPSSPAQGDMWFNTSSNTVSGIGKELAAVYNGNKWRAMSETVFTATGGTITTSGGYTIHTFTSSGTFTPGVSGLVEYLVVGGGGGGNGDSGGGGGAGGFLTAENFSVSAGGIAVTVGAGGAYAFAGANSAFSSITAIGGGRGSGNVQGSYSSTVGGSGGGASGGGGSTTGSAGTSGQGNAGGNSVQATSNYPAGGGGGAGAVGGTPANGSANPGNGGVGLASSISGSSVFYAGGGGGGGGGSASSGGNGGGGGEGASATANTGGGGGGNSSGGAGAGGSGIVIIRYLT